MGAFGSDSNSKHTSYAFGNVTSSEGGVIGVAIGGHGNVLPGGTLYKVAKGGSINLSVTGATPNGSGSYLASAIEGQAMGAFGSTPAVPAAVPGVDRKTLFVGLAVALVLFGVLFYFRRR